MDDSMDDYSKSMAFHLRMLIETRQPEGAIGQQAQELVRALGGTADLREMTPGAAALYLVALVMTQPGN